MKNNNVAFILSNYVKPIFLFTHDSSNNCSIINNNILFSGFRNYTFLNFKYRNIFRPLIGKHLWFNDTLWSDEKIYKLEGNKTTFLKYLTKTSDHSKRSSGDEDFRVVSWGGGLYAFYSKIIEPFHVYDEHICLLDKNFNIVGDKPLKTKNKIEKNWQPIEQRPFECVYSYKPFQIVNVQKMKFQELPGNEVGVNYRGSTPIIRYNDKNIGIVHIRHETNDSYFYTHYFVVFDSSLKLIKVSKPFSFMGAEIEFCIYMENNGNAIQLCMSINEQLSFKFEIPFDVLDKILSNSLNNNEQDDNLYDNLYSLAIQNGNILTSICLATYSKNVNIIEEAIHNNFTSKLSLNKKKVLQTLLLGKYNKTL